MTGHKHTLLATVVGVVSLAVYANATFNDFAMDDVYTVVGNPNIRSLSDAVSSFFDVWGHDAQGRYERQLNRAYWRPLTQLTFAVDFQLWKLNPLGFHLGNIVLHGFVSIFVLFLLLQLEFSKASAFVGSFIFAIHPIHTEAVNLITYRTELLSTALCVSALVLYLHARRQLIDGHRVSVCYMVGIATLYLLALAAKETAVTLPAWFVAIDACILLRQGRSLRSSLKSCLLSPLTVTLALCCLGYLLFRHHIVTKSAINFFSGLRSDLVFFSVCKLYYRYIQLVIFPWPLLPFHDWSVLPPAVSWSDTTALLGLSLLVLTGSSAVMLLNKYPRAAIGLICWLVGLLPFSHIVSLPVGLAERFLYFPGIGLTLAAAELLQPLLDKRAKQVVPALVVFVVLMSGLTVKRNSHWKNDWSLWSRAVADFPACFSAHLNIGKLHLESGRLSLALQSFSHAQSILPNMLANVEPAVKTLQQMRRYRDAKQWVERYEAENGISYRLRSLLNDPSDQRNRMQ